MVKIDVDALNKPNELVVKPQTGYLPDTIQSNIKPQIQNMMTL